MHFSPEASPAWRRALRVACTALIVSYGTAGAAAPPPAWVTRIAPGTWSAIAAENTADDIDPKRDAATNQQFPRTPPYEGNTGYLAVWEAWSGGAYAPEIGACGSILNFGGGPDYRGNAVIALNVCGGSSGAPVWQRLSDPYNGPIKTSFANGAYPDGSPAPPHSFDLLTYDPLGKSLVLVEAYSGIASSMWSSTAWIFDTAIRRWRGPYAHRGAGYGVSAYDSKRKLVWFQPEQGRKGELTSLNPKNGARRYYGWPPRSGIGGLDAVMGYDPKRDRLVATSFRSGGRVVAEHRLDDPSKPWISVEQENAPKTLWGQHALAWSQRRGAWIVWMSHSGADVYELKYLASNASGTPKYRWTKLTAAGNTVKPLAKGKSANGAFEKFQVVGFSDGSEVLLGQLRLQDGLMAFRLPGGTAAQGSGGGGGGDGANAPASPVTTVPSTTVVSERRAPLLTVQGAAIAPGHWASIITDNSAAAVDPAKDPTANPRFPGAAPYRGNSGYRALWEAWNSGAYAPSLGSCGGLLYFGGGHVDYFGNEVVGLDLCGGSGGGPIWRRLSNPYAGTIKWPLTASGAYPDGTPSPPHTHDLLTFDPGSNSLILLNSQVSGPQASYSKHAWRFNLDTRQWFGPYEHRGATEGVSAYDTKRRLVWFQPVQGKAGELTSFDPISGAFRYYGWPYTYGIGSLDSMMGYDPERDKLVLTGFRGEDKTVAERDLNVPAGPWRVAVQTNVPAVLHGQHAFAWSKVRNAWIVWVSSGGSMVYELRNAGATSNGQPKYSWSELTASDNRVVPVANPGYNGAYEKFQIVSPADGVELLIGQINLLDGVFAFRVPPPGSEPIPTNHCGESGICPGSKFAEPGWSTVCSQPGIFVCDNFGDRATLDGEIAAGDTTPQLDNGHLVFEIRSGSGANAGGDYRVQFPAVGEGQFLAFAYRVKANAAANTLEGRKEFILWRGSASCTDLELAQTHFYTKPVITPYTECGGNGFSIPLGQHDYQWQYPDYDCTYGDIKLGVYDDCAFTHDNQWENFYVEIRLGTFGQSNSHIVMWHKTDGGTWKRYISRDDFTFNGSGGFDHFMLTPYMTGKDRSLVHERGEVRYDHLIMSSDPFNVDSLLGK